MKLNLLNQVFSFHDFRLIDIENLPDKTILYFDQGLKWGRAKRLHDDKSKAYSP